MYPHTIFDSTKYTEDALHIYGLPIGHEFEVLSDGSLKLMTNDAPFANMYIHISLIDLAKIFKFAEKKLDEEENV